MNAGNLGRSLCAAVTTALLCLIPTWAFAHPSLEAYAREDVAVSVDTDNIDIRIRITFPANLSVKERKLMDSDGNGKLSVEEKDTYVEGILKRTEQLVRLSIDKCAVTLIPLEDAVLDLQDAPGVEAHPHELRLAFFARVPEAFGVDSTIQLDSALWSHVPLMLSVVTQADEGVRLTKSDAQGLRKPAKKGTLFRLTEARCTAWTGRQQSERRTPR